LRLWHFFLAIFLSACVLTAARSDAGRVAIVVFVFGLAEFICGTTAVMALFQTVGALGEAKRFSAYALALTATMLVTFVATIVMNALLWAGVGLVQKVVSEYPVN
jgi:hypothetical protein